MAISRPSVSRQHPSRPSTPTLFALIAILTALALPAAAGAERVELTPFGGFRFDGEAEDHDFFPPIDLEIDEGTSYGLLLDVRIVGGLSVEFLWSHQSTELFEDRGVFDDLELFDLDVDYYHAGVHYQWTPGQVRPFIGLAVGVTQLSPDFPGLGGETRPSASFGGGVKLMVSRNLGFRFEGRVYTTLLDLDDDDFCDCPTFDDDDTLTQGEVLAGLVLAF